MASELIITDKNGSHSETYTHPTPQLGIAGGVKRYMVVQVPT